MQPFTHDTLEIGVRPDEARSTLELTWRGKSRDRQPGQALTPWLTAALDEAARLKLSVEMRFDEVEFFNSATVMVLIQTIHAARKKGVPLTMFYAESVEWQRLSFAPMSVFEQADSFRVAAARPT